MPIGCELRAPPWGQAPHACVRAVRCLWAATDCVSHELYRSPIRSWQAAPPRRTTDRWGRSLRATISPVGSASRSPRDTSGTSAPFVAQTVEQRDHLVELTLAGRLEDVDRHVGSARRSGLRHDQIDEVVDHDPVDARDRQERGVALGLDREQLGRGQVVRHRHRPFVGGRRVAGVADDEDGRRALGGADDQRIDRERRADAPGGCPQEVVEPRGQRGGLLGLGRGPRSSRGRSASSAQLIAEPAAWLLS